MRTSLSEYTIGEIENMRDVIGNANYDVYDKIMNHICWEFDDIMIQDKLLINDIASMTLIKQLNFFISSFVMNKKMKLTEKEEQKLRELIYLVDKEALKRPQVMTFNTYTKSYRKCMLEFLDKSAHFNVNTPTISKIK